MVNGSLKLPRAVCFRDGIKPYKTLPFGSIPSFEYSANLSTPRIPSNIIMKFATVVTTLIAIVTLGIGASAQATGSCDSLQGAKCEPTVEDFCEEGKMVPLACAQPGTACCYYRPESKDD
ncbi:hypothetical protein D9756_009235 [Leucocoprinus leucothites]|uniref:Uncharacterized protein n=1 Tax=Leucocoprinus leucothites TaxID=201217 RepID=A0A8H5CY76_9AGAR|nr:hypothetical protein D9756_009235 [Leucoagaricus leucothites]